MTPRDNESSTSAGQNGPADTFDRIKQSSALEHRIFEEALQKASEELNRKIEESTAKLRATTARLQTLLQALPDIVLFKDPQGRYQLINRAAEEALGTTLEKIKGKTVDDLLPADTARQCRLSEREAIRNHRSIRVEESRNLPDGRTLYYDTIKVPIYDDCGEPQGVIAVSRDVTEKKRIEHSLQQSEAGYRALFEGLPDAIFLADPETGLILDANRAASRLMKRPVAELIGLHQSDLHPQHGERQMTEPFVKHTMATTTESTVDPIESAVLRPDGSTVPVEIMAGFVELNGKQVLQGVFRDITERRKAEERLLESEARHRTLFNNAMDAIFLLEIDEEKGNPRYLDVNDIACERYGYSREELVTMSPMDIVPPEYHNEIGKKMRSLVQSGTARAEIRTVTKSGKIIPVEINSQMFSMGGKKVVLTISRDITERWKAEEALKEANARLETLVQSIPDLVAFKDTEGRHLVVNKALEKFMGMSSEELLGKSAEDIFPPADAAECNLSDRMAMQSPVSIRSEEQVSAGDSPIFLDTIKSPVHDENGRVIGLAMVSRDITDLKKAELQIRASLQEKEVLLKEVHHRVKNNMQIISSLLNLQSGQIEDQNLVEIFKESQNRIKAMALVHRNLYQSQDLAHLDFRGYIRSLIGGLFKSYGIRPDRVKMQLDINDVPLGIDHAVLIGLLINELVSNSFKHAFVNEKEGEIEVGLRQKPDGEIELTVGDNGIGLPKDMDVRKTESLGLQLVTSLAENQLKGKVEVVRGEGTFFRIGFRAEDSMAG